MLICPVCKKELIREAGRYTCVAGHSFDIAKEGYVNLLLGSKSGDKRGDAKFSARSRRDFLSKGYYAPLKDALVDLFRDKSGSLMDICCGEGYYTSALAENLSLQVYGFDISREMVRLAAKRGGATCFVANMAAIPVAEDSFDYAAHLFAPFMEGEFCRILKPGGRLYSVIPGKFHLFGLKQALYENPYENDEQLPQTKRLTLLGTRKVTANIRLETAEDIEAVFRMTPYYFHTSDADRKKLEQYSYLDTSIEFIIAEYRYKGE